MNVIKVKFNIDIDNEQQLKSFNNFVASLKSNGGTSPVIEAPVKDIKAKQEATVQQPATQQTTKPAAQASTPEPGANEGEHTAVKKLDAIRKLIGLKAGEHREAMKLKLNEYGVSTATDLPVDKYAEFHEYLEKLA
jgi:hypothetical protein